jgi:hypothetical protein
MADVWVLVSLSMSSNLCIFHSIKYLKEEVENWEELGESVCVCVCVCVYIYIYIHEISGYHVKKAVYFGPWYYKVV